MQIELADGSFDALADAALAERRPVRDHASWLIERALARRGRREGTTAPSVRRQCHEVAGAGGAR